LPTWLVVLAPTRFACPLVQAKMQELLLDQLPTGHQAAQLLLVFRMLPSEGIYSANKRLYNKIGDATKLLQSPK